MKIYYIWDALCGWCYGFGAILTPFLENHPEIEVEIISGGLFINERSLPIVNYPHIPSANERISQVFGVKFGENYQKMLQKGELVLNSYHSAVGFSVLKENLPTEKHILVAKDIQHAFYFEGKSLSEMKTYEKIAEKHGLNPQEIGKKIEHKFAENSFSHPEFQQARYFGVQSYPTLILEKDGKYYDLKGNALTLNDLENNLQKILENHTITPNNETSCDINGNCH